MVWWGPFYAWTCIKKIDGYDYEPTTTKETNLRSKERKVAQEFYLFILNNLVVCLVLKWLIGLIQR